MKSWVNKAIARETSLFRKPDAFGEAYGRYLTARDIGVEPMSRADSISLLRTLNVYQALVVTGQVNVALQVQSMEDMSYQAAIAQFFLSPENLDRLSAVSPSASKTNLFLTPYQLRIAIALLLKYGSRSGGRVVDQSDAAHEFGHFLLSIGNTFYVESQVDEKSQLWPLQLHLSLTQNGFITDGKTAEDLAVKGYMLETLVSKLGIKERFERKLGFSPEQYQTAISLFWVNAAKADAKFATFLGPATISFEYAMGQVAAPAALSQRIRSDLMVDVSAVSETDFADNDPDLALLSGKPLALINGNVHCLDFEYLQVRLARNLWNMFTEITNEDKFGAFKGEAGYVFEEYCNNILKTAVSQRKSFGAWMGGPEVLRRAPADGIYVDRTTAVVFEFKTSTLSPAALYRNDVNQLEKEIQEKYIHGRKGDKQGFIQCAQHLETMLRHKSEFHLEEAVTITPCLVTMEPALSSATCLTYVQDAASPLFRHFGSLVKRPLVLHPEELAMLVMRSRWQELSYMIAVLAREPMLRHGTVKNAILNLWPNDRLEASGKEVPVARPLYLLEESIRYFKINGIDGPSKTCPICEETLNYLSDANGRPAWWCSTCKVRTQPTNEEVQEHRDHQRRVRDRVGEHSDTNVPA